MDFFSAMNVSSSGMTAERTRMNLISSNIANANATRTPEGGPYKRKDPVFSAIPATGGFASTLSQAGDKGVKKVEVALIQEDQSPPRGYSGPISTPLRKRESSVYNRVSRHWQGWLK